MTRIVAFAGRKQSGKTTCSEAVLKVSPPLNAKIYNFADPLKKDVCMNIFGLSYQQCYGDDIDKNTSTGLMWEGKDLTAREVMQFVGTDIFRKMKNDVWASATINKISIEKPDIAIIADCRFPNEVQAVKDAGGTVIKLTRNPYNSDHASETALDISNYDHSNFDLVLDNDNINIEEQTSLVIHFLARKGLFQL
jgi:hypothetical protein